LTISFVFLILLQLDEWVLCRVRQKIGSPRSSWEDSNVLSYEPTNQFQQMNEISNPEPVKNYVQNEYPMLPYILASKIVLPNSIGMASDNVKPHASFYEDNLNIIGAQFLSSATEGLFNPLKRKAVEDDMEMDFYAVLNKNLSREVDDGKERLEKDLSKENNFYNFDQWTSIIQPQELNSLVFTGYT
jgi:hypothetical protein